MAIGKAKKLGFGGYRQAGLYLLNRKTKWETDVLVNAYGISKEKRRAKVQRMYLLYL
jgi:hypothetical protein